MDRDSWRGEPGRRGVAWVSKPPSQNKASSPLGGNNDTISSQYQGPDITRWGWPECVCVVPRPLARPWPMGPAWKSPGLASGASKTCEEGRGRADPGSAALSHLSVSRPPPLYQSPLASMSSAHFNRGPAYGLSAEVKNKVRPEGTA